ncbi:MAG: membrane protein insertion efficiency factor YidD [Clostridia bacterium]|nr:membrane protein insertion efficiency factor YidD [Clostridia bacterium]
MKSGNFLIQYYKHFINPVIGSKCKHIPSCSAYMGQAIAKKGYIKGSTLGMIRILKCNPFSKGGFKPVKDDLKGNAKWLL